MKAGIVVVGSLNLDHVVTVERLPLEGQSVAGRNYVAVPGGKGLNQAVASARQGLPTAMVGCIGSAPAGEILSRVLASEEIDLRFVRRTEGVSSGIALITVAAGGANTVVVAAGANGTVSPADVAHATSVIEDAAVVLTQLEIPLRTVEAALLAGRRTGALTVLNPAPAHAALPRRILELVDVIVPNETEAQILTGQRDPAKAAGALVGGGCQTAIVTLGSKGALLLESTDPARAVTVPPFAVTAVDTTAAGDAFCGALAASLAKDTFPADGVLVRGARRGAAAGAIATTVLGAVPSLPDAADVADLLAGRPVAARK